MMRVLLSRMLLGVAFLAGATGLFRFAQAVAINASGANAKVVPTELLTSRIRVICAPRTLIEHARRHPTPKDFESLASGLTAEHLDDAWFALISEDQLSTGEMMRGVKYVYPAKTPHEFPSSKHAMQTLASASETSSSRSDATVRIFEISPEISKSNPASVIGDLVERTQ